MKNKKKNDYAIQFKINALNWKCDEDLFHVKVLKIY